MTAQTELLLFRAGSQPVATSEDAANRLSAEELSERRLKVLRHYARAWRERRDGHTADEIVGWFGGAANSWAPRVTELLQMGLLDRLDGKEGRRRVRRRTRSGGSGFVHVISARGLRYLREQP